jgi:oligosaccharide repeat unit polymerase
MTAISLWCAVGVVFMIGLATKRHHAGWLAPAPFLALYWLVALALPPLLAPTYAVAQVAVWYIVLLVAAFALGSWASISRAPLRDGGVNPRPLNVHLLRQLVLVGTGAGLMATVVVQLANGYSVMSIVSLKALVDRAATFSIERYAGDSRTPVMVPLLMSLTYAAGLVAPFAARGLPRWRAVASYVGPLAGAVMYAVLTTARAGMLTVAFFLAAGWIASWTYWQGEAPRLRLQSIIAVVGSIIALAAAFVAIAFLRVGSFGGPVRLVIADKTVAYAVGYMPGFSEWLTHSAPTWPSSWGAATFAGLISIGDGRTAGFSDRATLGPGGGTTNIFTAGRYLIEDFGVVGAPVVAVIVGWLVAVAWRRTIERPGVAPVIVLLCFYAYTLNSNTQTIFLFTNICLSVVLASLALGCRTPGYGGLRVIPPAMEVRASTGG